MSDISKLYLEKEKYSLEKQKEIKIKYWNEVYNESKEKYEQRGKDKVCREFVSQ
jgi:hypothetical protein